MKVVTRQVVELDAETVERVFRERLDSMVGDHFERKGKVYQLIDTSTSHYSSREELVKNPPDVLLHAIRLRDALRKP